MTQEMQPRRVENTATAPKSEGFIALRRVPGGEMSPNDAYEAMMFDYALQESGYPKKASQSGEMERGQTYQM